MARIELRHTTIRFKDGFSGTATINEATPANGDTDFGIDVVTVNHRTGNPVIPIGARFTYAADSANTVYTVTARTPDDTTGPTTNIVFTPALATARTLPLDNAVLTFLPQQVSIRLGDGNLAYTEAKNFEYDLDRGTLDSVREGDDIPLEVSADMVYEFITTGTAENITPMDALSGTGGAAEWVSSSTDECEPYAIDMELEHTPPCSGAQKELTLFPDFRPDTKEVDLSAASISISGRCNATRPTVTRIAQ
jgi:hypothetical protein